jgi:hypothetical protein
MSAYEIAQAAGFIGTEADWLASLIGATGATGATGVTGASAYEIAQAAGFTGTEAEWLASLVGATGATGTTGASAYEAAQAAGFIGTEAEWLASLVGATGATGATGLDGAAGATGATGATGLDGAVGATGATGLDGAAGATGATGATGLDGAVGATGATGATGLDGAVGATGATGAGTTGATGATGLAGAGAIISFDSGSYTPPGAYTLPLASVVGGLANTNIYIGNSMWGPAVEALGAILVLDSTGLPPWPMKVTRGTTITEWSASFEAVAAVGLAVGSSPLQADLLYAPPLATTPASLSGLTFQLVSSINLGNIPAVGLTIATAFAADQILATPFTIAAGGYLMVKFYINTSVGVATATGFHAQATVAIV